MHNKIQWYFFGIIGLVIGILSFFIFRPFIPSIIISIFLALLFYPLYQKLLHFWPKKERLSAIVIVSVVLLGVITPLSFLGIQLVKESQSIYVQLKDTQINTAEFYLNNVEKKIQTILPDFSFDVPSYIETILDWTSSKIGGFVFGTIEGIFLALLVVFLFYYFLRNGGKIKDVIINLSPLPDDYDKQIASAVQKTVNSVLRGSLLIAFIQGILVGIGLWIFGVPNPVIWGSIAAVSALVPGLGTGLVLIPAIIYLFINDHIGMTIGLTIWGVVVVGLVDNILVPLFYGKNIHIHPVFVLLSVIGGLSYFGFLGFIFGPVILSLLIVLINIYKLSTNIISTYEKK